MKTIRRSHLTATLFAALSLACALSYSQDWQGAWRASDGDEEQSLLIVDGYWSFTAFEKDPARFIRTFGGTYDRDGQAPAIIEFDSENPQRVGAAISPQVELDGDVLLLHHEDGSTERWERVQEQPTDLNGVWRISGRQREGEIQEMPLRARRTLKVLTGSRFQWIAMNIETGEFSGTGGGTYTFEDGVYTENIGFFSRDDNRVGASLEFNGEVKDGDWHHSGLSSRGDPIYEVWTRFDPH